MNKLDNNGFDFDFDESELLGTDVNNNTENENDQSLTNDELEPNGDITEDNSFMAEDDGFGDFADPDAEGRRATKKSAIIVILVGVIGIVVIFAVLGFVQKLMTREPKGTESNTTNVVETEQGKDKNTGILGIFNKNDKETENNKTEPVQQVTNTQIDNNSWREFESSDIDFAKDYIQSTFSVTGIKHYVKVIDENNLEVKTILSGALAGLSGTYEVEVPYSKGSKLDIGVSFDVTVQLGKMSNGRTVVGDIKY